MPLFGWLGIWNWKSTSMPKGIHHACASSHSIQSRDPLYWGELDTTQENEDTRLLLPSAGDFLFFLTTGTPPLLLL